MYVILYDIEFVPVRLHAYRNMFVYRKALYLHIYIVYIYIYIYIKYRDTRQKFRRPAVYTPKQQSEHLSLGRRSEARPSCCNAWCGGVAKVLWRAVISGTDRPYTVHSAGAGGYTYTLKRAHVRSSALPPQQPPRAYGPRSGPQYRFQSTNYSISSRHSVKQWGDDSGLVQLLRPLYYIVVVYSRSRRLRLRNAHRRRPL